jgi:hypothetical protein
VHRPALALVVPGRLAHQLGHHPAEVATLGDEVPMPAMRRRDLVLVRQRAAHARGHSLLADVQVEEARELGALGEAAGGLLEQADAHHPPVQVHQHVT